MSLKRNLFPKSLPEPENLEAKVISFIPFLEAKTGGMMAFCNDCVHQNYCEEAELNGEVLCRFFEPEEDGSDIL